MIELKKLNVHRIVATKEEADKLIAAGFSIVKDDCIPTPPVGKPTKGK
jgi:hypothetical protein